jgi:hypothetical protein
MLWWLWADRCNGWLGMLLGTKLWYGFYGATLEEPTAFDKRVDELCRELGPAPQQPNSSSSAAATTVGVTGLSQQTQAAPPTTAATAAVAVAPAPAVVAASRVRPPPAAATMVPQEAGASTADTHALVKIARLEAENKASAVTAATQTERARAAELAMAVQLERTRAAELRVARLEGGCLFGGVAALGVGLATLVARSLK